MSKRQAGPTVLIIEDNVDLGKLFRTFLSLDKVTSTVCIWGKDALEKLDNEEIKPSLVILDMHLPDMSGEEIFAYLQERYPQIAIMIVTADLSLYERYRQIHPTTYGKPMNMVEFRAAALEALP